MSKEPTPNTAVTMVKDNDPINNNYGSQEVAIEAPHLPGNYSARTSNKWMINDSTTASLDSLGRGETGEKVSSLQKDEIHSKVSPFKVSPGQLYSTDSGSLFHAGKLLICLTGLPGRGKTHMSVSLTRYLRWLGVSAQVFHFDDFRRQALKSNEISPSFFSQKPSDLEISKIKETVVETCLNNIEDFLLKNNGQVAIYDAINGIAKNRIELQERFNKLSVKVVFIESLIENDNLLANSLKDAIKSPDYEGYDSDEARKDFDKRVESASDSYEVISEVDPTESMVLSYIKSINFGERLVLNRSQYGYLLNRMTFFLLNTRIKKGSIFFARCGDTGNHKNLLFKLDPSLTEKGKAHSKVMMNTLVKLLMNNRNIKESEINKKLMVWTSTRTRTIETGSVFQETYDIQVTQRSEMNQLNPGNIETLTREEIKYKFPIEYDLFKKDPYHVRFPRAESYHDLAVRLEPLILEMERNTKNILIIGHESVLRVLYGYLLNCSSNDIPYLKFPPEEIVEVQYNAYANTSSRIKITEKRT